METFKEGDFFYFKKDDKMVRVIGVILEETKDFYRCKIIAASMPHLVDNYKQFFKKGNIIQHCKKIPESEAKYGYIRDL